MVPKTKVGAVETWELGELLLALCQVAQDAGDPESPSGGAENQRFTRELPATEPGGGQS